MTFENLDIDDDLDFVDDDGETPEESSNRTFLIVAAILGVIALFSLICIAVFAIWYIPSRNTQQTAQAETVAAQNATVDAIINETSTAAAEAVMAPFTSTFTATPLLESPTLTLTSTPVVVEPVETEAATVAPEMLTATALHATLTANAELFSLTLTARATATAIPETGFADEVGLPVMLGLAVLLIVIFFLARRLRTA
jgi:hypothetical protein